MNLPDAPPPADPDATVAPTATAPTVVAATAPVATAPDLRPRPLIERVGMAAIALVAATMFVIVSAAAFIGGEPFLGIMGAAGVLMVLWVGGLTLIRG